MEKPPGLVSHAWTWGMDSKCNHHGRVTQGAPLGHKACISLQNQCHKKDQCMTIWEGQAIILQLPSFPPCLFYSLNLKWENTSQLQLKKQKQRPNNLINWKFHICLLIPCCNLMSYTSICVNIVHLWVFSLGCKVTSITLYLFLGPL